VKFRAFILLFLAASAQAGPSLEEWIASETRVSQERLLGNISPPGAVPGSVLASPSGDSPNYRFHWTRDASLVMDQVLAFAPDRLADFVALSRKEQLTPSAQGLGEPRFRLEGAADTLPWARPQFDGPALRALTLIRALPLATGGFRKDALDSIRVDLNFTAQYWRVPCFDLWEELRGLHFYTQSVQYGALLAGADLFDSQGEVALSQRFRKEAEALAGALELFWDPAKSYIGATRELEIRPEDPHYKEANLDTSVILAALHAHVDHGILSITDDRLLATAHALEQAFSEIYAINLHPKHAGEAVAIGRFTDDRYFGGNPWYLTTAAFAELYYRVAEAIQTRGELGITPRNRGFLNLTLPPGARLTARSPKGKALIAALRRKGDDYLALLRQYVGSQGEMSEQFDRDAGVPVSAYDLSWSYAAYLAAAKARPSGRSP
jgi:glucoamylase